MKYSMLFMLKAAVLVSLFTSIPGETFAANRVRQIADQPAKQVTKQTNKQKNVPPAKQKNSQPVKQKNGQKGKQSNNQAQTITIPILFGKLRMNDVTISMSK